MLVRFLVALVPGELLERSGRTPSYL